MSHSKVLAALVVGLLAVSLTVRAAEDKKGETIEGTIIKVDPSGHQIHVELKEKKKRQVPERRICNIRPSTTFVFVNGDKKQEVKRQEAYKHEQLKEGAAVKVISDATGRILEVRVSRAREEETRK